MWLIDLTMHLGLSRKRCHGQGVRCASRRCRG
jgi:hypothetical protein